MNYRHGFHVGNAADVLKHAVLAWIVARLAVKPAPFRVLDLHAGAGLYNLGGEEARRSPEWRGGVGRLLGPEAGGAEAETAGCDALLGPWRAAVTAARAQHGPAAYPGSSLVALHGMRAGDRLLAVELHAEEAAKARAALAGDRRAKLVALDAATAWKAFTPPLERRGLVLVDPPYEAPDEFEHVASAFAAAFPRWRTGIVVIWHPVKDAGLADGLHARVTNLAEGRVLRLELAMAAPQRRGPLVASGLLVVNPPFGLAEVCAAGLPGLAARLEAGPGGGWRCDGPA